MSTVAAKAAPKWDATEPIAVLMDGKKELGAVFPMRTANDRAAHSQSCGGHCCCSFNWIPDPDDPDPRAGNTVAGGFGHSLGTRMFTVRDMDGWARALVLTFTADKDPGPGYQGGSEYSGRDAVPRILGEETLVACHIVAGYDYSERSNKGQVLEAAARKWWASLPVANKE